MARSAHEKSNMFQKNFSRQSSPVDYTPDPSPHPYLLINSISFFFFFGGGGFTLFWNQNDQFLLTFFTYRIPAPNNHYAHKRPPPKKKLSRQNYYESSNKYKKNTSRKKKTVKILTNNESPVWNEPRHRTPQARIYLVLSKYLILWNLKKIYPQDVRAEVTTPPNNEQFFSILKQWKLG
jgi:hypothetical protein